MKAAVLDTSVIFKWYHHVDEEDVETALLLRDAFLAGDLDVAIPDLLIYEFANALRCKSRLAPESVAATIGSLWTLGMQVHPADEIFSASIVRLSYEFNISVYDAAFLALARQLSATLVTADRVLHAKVRGKHAIMLLSDIVKES